MVPKTAHAEKLLDFDEALTEDLYELYLSDIEFGLLWKNGFFKLINETVDVNIDDYEDTNIKGIETLSKVIEVIQLEQSWDDDCDYLVKKILKLFAEAIQRDTGVYFYF